MRVLLTGGAGFIGSEVAALLVREEGALERLVVLDLLTYAGHEENLAPLSSDPRLSFVRGDVCDRALLARLFEAHAFDAVLHLAAESHVDRSIADAGPFVRTNVSGTAALLDAALAAWRGKRGRFVHVSSDEVYGALGPTGRFTEESPYAPSSPYAASKAASDMLARAYHRTHALDVVITHGANTYGPRQTPEKLVPVVITRAIAGEPLPVYGQGKQVREWLFVEDHARAILAALARGRAGETYDFGGERELPNFETVGALADLVDAELGRPAGASRARIAFVADRPGHDFRYALTSEKARRELGWAPRVAFADGMARTVKWYAANEAWVRAARAKLGCYIGGTPA